MKKNQLVLLLAVVFGVTTAAATVTARIQVDKAANVVVTNGMYGTVVALTDGMNQVELDESRAPLVIKPRAVRKPAMSCTARGSSLTLPAR